jgi:hypothetical protein
VIIFAETLTSKVNRKPPFSAKFEERESLNMILATRLKVCAFVLHPIPIEIEGNPIFENLKV